MRGVAPGGKPNVVAARRAGRPGPSRLAVVHTRVQPYRPETNGEFERFQPHQGRRIGLMKFYPNRDRPPSRDACIAPVSQGDARAHPVPHALGEAVAGVHAPAPAVALVDPPSSWSAACGAGMRRSSTPSTMNSAGSPTHPRRGGTASGPLPCRRSPSGVDRPGRNRRNCRCHEERLVTLLPPPGAASSAPRRERPAPAQPRGGLIGTNDRFCCGAGSWRS